MPYVRMIQFGMNEWNSYLNIPKCKQNHIASRGDLTLILHSPIFWINLGFNLGVPSIASLITLQQVAAPHEDTHVVQSSSSSGAVNILPRADSLDVQRALFDWHFWHETLSSNPDCKETPAPLELSIDVLELYNDKSKLAPREDFVVSYWTPCALDALSVQIVSETEYHVVNSRHT